MSNRRVQELQSRSKSSTSSQGTEMHSSPTHSNVTSDSEGVVAVLPKTNKVILFLVRIRTDNCLFLVIKV